jgi:hypothetical protein
MMSRTGFMKVLARLAPWGRPERYRIACLYEFDPRLEAQLWRRWPELFPMVDPVVKAMPDRCFMRSVQYNPLAAAWNDEKGSVTRFSKLAWSEANNRKWVSDLAKRPDYELEVTEVWSPWRKDLEDRKGGPHLYIKLDAANEGGSPAPEHEWQSLTIVIRHDVLETVKPAVQAVLNAAGQLMTAPQLLAFDRGWAESGGYRSLMSSNALQDSHPAMLDRWCRNHPNAVLPTFDV